MQNNNYEDIVWGILRGRTFGALSMLQGAVESENLESYIEETGYPEMFSIGHTKKEAIEVREELIKLILQALKNGKTRGESMKMDHYARLFHALARLNVPKADLKYLRDSGVPMRDAALELWLMDDGSDTIGRYIMKAAWIISEEQKK